jgi:uncharacterized protein (TIGR03083 family)
LQWREPSVNPADGYERVHERICALVGPEDADVPVPTCPGWTVKDVIAHLAGFFAAYRSGADDAFGPDWGEREVAARRNRSFQECLKEWTEALRDPGDLFQSHLGPVAVSDALAHEQDVRTALDKPGARDDDNIVPAVEMGLSWVEKKMEAEGSPALKIVTETMDRKIGQGEPVATLRTSTFDLFRTLHGRRTVDQVRAMKWEGDPDPWMADLFLFGPAKYPVEN